VSDDGRRHCVPRCSYYTGGVHGRDIACLISSSWVSLLFLLLDPVFEAYTAPSGSQRSLFARSRMSTFTYGRGEKANSTSGGSSTQGVSGSAYHTEHISALCSLPGACLLENGKGPSGLGLESVSYDRRVPRARNVEDGHRQRAILPAIYAGGYEPLATILAILHMIYPYCIDIPSRSPVTPLRDGSKSAVMTDVLQCIS
jgi:hypothetical protein